MGVFILQVLKKIRTVTLQLEIQVLEFQANSYNVFEKETIFLQKVQIMKQVVVLVCYYVMS